LAFTTSVDAADAADEEAATPRAEPATTAAAMASRAVILLARILGVLAGGAERCGSRRRDVDISVLLKGRNLDGAMAFAMLGM
jgi:hypothetical protein